MSSSLSEAYLRWLVPQMGEKHEGHDRTYMDLSRLLFDTEFLWFVPHDDNRVMDGRDLRSEFCRLERLTRGSLDDIGPVSFLEVLIGLSRRLEFAAGGQADFWAWQLVSNLGLHKLFDPLTARKARQARDILNVCMRRTYNPNGLGGFFPLAWPDEDQTKVELWYQMAAYIAELHPEY